MPICTLMNLSAFAWGSILFCTLCGSAWSAPTEIDDVIRSRPALNADGSLLYVAGYKKGVIHALDTDTGAEMNWGTVSRNPGRLPGDLAADGVHLYAMPIMVDERIQALELATGKITWNYPSTESE